VYKSSESFLPTGSAQQGGEIVPHFPPWNPPISPKEVIKREDFGITKEAARMRISVVHDFLDL